MEVTPRDKAGSLRSWNDADSATKLDVLRFARSDADPAGAWGHGTVSDHIARLRNDLQFNRAHDRPRFRVAELALQLIEQPDQVGFGVR